MSIALCAFRFMRLKNTEATRFVVVDNSVLREINNPANDVDVTGGIHTVTGYEMSGEPYSQKSGCFNHTYE